MRSDYGLYGVAIICFILAAVFVGSLVPGYPVSSAQGIAVTVVFLLIGVIAAAVGFSARPKASMPSQEPALSSPPATPLNPIEEPAPVTEEFNTPPTPPPTPVEEVSIKVESAPEPASPQRIEPTEPSPAVTPPEEPAPVEVVAEEKPKTTRRRRKKAIA